LPGTYKQDMRIYGLDGVAPTLSTKQGGTKVLVKNCKQEYEEVKPGDRVNWLFLTQKLAVVELENNWLMRF
jgi:DNA (cytosine-5)-methyltransferase 1